MTAERKESFVVAGIAAFFIFASMLFGSVITVSLWVTLLMMGG